MRIYHVEPKKRRGHNKIGCYVLVELLLGVLIIAFPIMNMSVERSGFENCTVEVQGVVTNFKTDTVTFDGEYGTEEKTSYTPVVRYTTLDGIEYEVAHSISKEFAVCEVGETVRILYDPEDPTFFKMPDHDKKGTWGYLMISAFGMCIALHALSLMLKMRLRPKAY